MSALRDMLLTMDRAEGEAFFASKTRSQYLGKNRVLCNVLGSKKFFALGDDVGFSVHMIFDGFWEYWLTRNFAEHINEGDVVLDVGANLGYYTVLASDLVGPEGKVVAVEPNPALFGFMMDAVNLNGYGGRVTGLQAALTDAEHSSWTRFFCPTAQPMNGRFVEPGDDEAKLLTEGTIVDVETIHDLSQHFERLDFIKIDVEGAELQVLKALLPLIEKHRPKVVCEFKFTRGYTFDDLIELLGVDRLHHLEYTSEIVELTREMAETERYDQDWLVCLNFQV